MSNEPRQPQSPPFWRSRSGVALLIFLGIAGFLLVYEHRAHIPGDYWLLGGFLAACLLMHGIMHGSHGGDHHHDDAPDEEGK